jgi:hypothetical protein
MGSTIGITHQLLSRSSADVHTPALVYAAYLGLILGSIGGAMRHQWGLGCGLGGIANLGHVLRDYPAACRDTGAFSDRVFESRI